MSGRNPVFRIPPRNHCEEPQHTPHARRHTRTYREGFHDLYGTGVKDPASESLRVTATCATWRHTHTYREGFHDLSEFVQTMLGLYGIVALWDDMYRVLEVSNVSVLGTFIPFVYVHEHSKK